MRRRKNITNRTYGGRRGAGGRLKTESPAQKPSPLHRSPAVWQLPERTERPTLIYILSATRSDPFERRRVGGTLSGVQHSLDLAVSLPRLGKERNCFRPEPNWPAQGLMAFYVILLFALFSVLILRLGFTQPCRKIV